MRLDDLDPSKNVRDHGRGGGGGGMGGGGGILGLLFSFLPMLMGRQKMGCGTILLIGGAALAFMYFSGGGGGLLGGGSGSSEPGTAYDTQSEVFAGRVLASTEQTWTELFRQNGSTYRAPVL